MHRNRQQDDPGRRVRAYLREHPLVNGDDALVERTAKCTEWVQLGLEDVLIGAGQNDRDLYLIFSGSVDVIIDGEVFARRRSGEVVGELELIAQQDKRVATVVAREATVVGRIADHEFARLADEHPVLWKKLAEGLARRLIDGPVAQHH